jgi:hypothetical protein
MTRTSNPYGSRPEEQREIAHYVETVEPLLRQGAGVELDGRAEPASLVDAVETLIAASEGSRPGATTRRCNAQSFAGWCESNTGPLQTIDSTAA